MELQHNVVSLGQSQTAALMFQSDYGMAAITRDHY